MTRFIELIEVGTQQRTTVNVDVIATIPEIPEGSKVVFQGGTWLKVTQSYESFASHLTGRNPMDRRV